MGSRSTLTILEERRKYGSETRGEGEGEEGKDVDCPLGASHVASFPEGRVKAAPRDLL